MTEKAKAARDSCNYPAPKASTWTDKSMISDNFISGSYGAAIALCAMFAAMAVMSILFGL